MVHLSQHTTLQLSLLCYFLANECYGFTQRFHANTRRQEHSINFHRRRAVPVDPVELANSVSDGINSLNHFGQHDSLETVLSTMYASTSDIMLKPAQGHSQPFWGAPDPYLSTGKSIAPSAKALLDLGVQKASDASSQDILPDVRTALSNGWKVLDNSDIHPVKVMPGFSPTGGILPYHDSRVPEETPETFAAQVEWSASFINVIDKIPYVAFAYALVEFFFLRPGIDLYKEDIEEEPSEVLFDTIMVTGVRMGVFALIAIMTLVVFG